MKEHEGARAVNYLVIAYRWGWLNNHWYPVYCGADEMKACAMASCERTDRGGKYGCTVWQLGEHGEMEKIVYHASSSYGEALPAMNYRLDYFERLGHVLENYCDGTLEVHAKQPDGHTILVPTRVTPEAQLVRERDEIRAVYDRLQAIHDKMPPKDSMRSDQEQP